MGTIIIPIVVLLILSLVVVVHEYGHYRAMRRNGVRVIEFTVGFGPTLWERRLASGTYFRIKPILIGGYALPATEGEGAIQHASGWSRFKIYMAGMLANSVAAFAAALALFYATERVPTIVVPFIMWAPEVLRPLVAALVISFGLWLATPALMGWLIVSHGMSFLTQDVAGPIGIVSQGGQMLAGDGGGPPTPRGLIEGVAMLFMWLNVALAGFNLMPFLPLDGGQVVRDLVKKFVGEKAASMYAKTTTLVFLAFFVFVMLSDIRKLLLHLTA